MKILISCSTSNTMSEIYKQEAQILGRELSRLDHELVFGSSTNGLLGIIYNEFKNNNNDITVVVPEELVGDLTEVDYTNRIVIGDVINHPAGLVNNCDCVVVLPGGMGTLAELSLAIHTRKFMHEKPIIIVNINGYFDNLLQFFSKQVEEKCLYNDELNLFKIAKNSYDAINIIRELN